MSSDPLKFYFKDYGKTKFIPHLICAHKQGSVPSAIAIDAFFINQIRKDAYYPKKPCDPGIPGQTRRAKLLKRITPPDMREDPYIVAFLIALAQRQKKHFKKTGTTRPPPSHFSVSLFMTHMPPSEEEMPSRHFFMHGYHAKIPLSLLRRLEEPGRVFEEEPGIPVRCYPVEFVRMEGKVCCVHPRDEILRALEFTQK